MFDSGFSIDIQTEPVGSRPYAYQGLYLSKTLFALTFPIYTSGVRQSAIPSQDVKEVNVQKW